MLPLTPTHFCKKYTMISIFKATSFRDLSVFCMLKSIPSPFYDFCWASLSFLPFSPQGRSFSPLPDKFSWVAVIRFSAFSATFPKRFWRSSLLWRRHGLWTARDPPNACGGAVRDDFFFGQNRGPYFGSQFVLGFGNRQTYYCCVLLLRKNRRFENRIDI